MILKKEERFASRLPTPVRAFIRRMVLERRYELLLEIVKLSWEITSLAKTNQTLVKCSGTVNHHGVDQFHTSPLKTNCAIEKNWEPQNKRILLLFKIIELN